MNRAIPGVLAVCFLIGVQAGPASGAAKKKRVGRGVSAAKAVDVRPITNEPPDVVDASASGISADVLRMALSATACAAKTGAIDESPETLTVIDYSRPSVEPRLWVFNLSSGELLFKELVAHGRNTGDNVATRFSNELNSHQSSIGLFVTDEPYVGSNGYSLRLDGLDEGFNDHARERAIVMHGAPYVDESLAHKQGRIGRSWGCPALREAVASKVIDRIRGGGVIFAYYPHQDWLQTSRFLNCGAS